jgi:hypothetical protein
MSPSSFGGVSAGGPRGRCLSGGRLRRAGEGPLPAPRWRAGSARGVAIRMAEAEHVVVRGLMVAVAVLVAPAPGPGTVGREEEQECDREKEKRPGTPGHPRSLHRDTSGRQSTLSGGRPLALTQTPPQRGWEGGRSPAPPLRRSLLRICRRISLTFEDFARQNRRFTNERMILKWLKEGMSVTRPLLDARPRTLARGRGAAGVAALNGALIGSTRPFHSSVSSRATFDHGETA